MLFFVVCLVGLGFVVVFGFVVCYFAVVVGVVLLFFPCRSRKNNSCKETVFLLSSLNVSLLFVAQMNVPRTQKIQLSIQIAKVLDLKETMG